MNNAVAPQQADLPVQIAWVGLGAGSAAAYMLHEKQTVVTADQEADMHSCNLREPIIRDMRLLESHQSCFQLVQHWEVHEQHMSR